MSVRNSIPGMLQASKTNPAARLKIHVVTFGNNAQWHIYPGVLIDEFCWEPIEAGGSTPMGAALDLVTQDLDSKIANRCYPSVVVLVTDGIPTDDFDKALSRFSKSVWGNKSVRIGIGIGPRSEIGWDVLERFMFDMPFAPLHAENSKMLSEFIRWSSTAVIETVSRAQQASHIPSLPETILDLTSEDELDIF